MSAERKPQPLVSITFEASRTQPRCPSAIKTISVEVLKPQDKRKFYKEEDFKITIQEPTNNKPCPLYRFHDGNNFMIVHFKPTSPSDAILAFLKEGIEVRYKDSRHDIFVFFGHSANQLRTRTCVLYNQREGAVDEILRQYGDFARIKNIAKRSARIGLLFSTAQAACELYDGEIGVVEDVKNNKYNFTDGCGFISKDCAEKVVRQLALENIYKDIINPALPSVFQIRIKGCKGILVLSPTLANGIQIRPSMEKFIWLRPEPHKLGIVDKGYSRPYEFGSLNKQFIMLLSALGIPDETFLHKQQQYFRDLQEITRNQGVAFRYLCAYGEFEMAERLVSTGSYDRKTLEKLEHLRVSVTGPQSTNTSPFQKAKKSAAQRLKIFIDESRNVYGVCDPSGFLDPGTVFFQPTIRGEPKVLHNVRVVVAKNPCYHPGDIRVLTCVDTPSCHHLVDCIVFPTKGRRPHADEIAGSDLDGDKYFVCWDKDLVPAEESQPCSYPAANQKSFKEFSRYDFVKYFAMYNSSTVAKLNTLFDKWADAKGISSPECELISSLFSKAIDSAKTGEKVYVSPHLAQGPKDCSVSGEYVWNKLFKRAKLFETDRFLEYEDVTDTSGVSEEILVKLLRNTETRCSEYRVLRFLYKWCIQNKADISGFLNFIDFSKLTLEQQSLAKLDLSSTSVDLEIAFNPLHQSHIITADDMVYFRVVQKPGCRCCLVYHEVGKEMSWSVLGNVLASPLAKLLIFKYDIAGTEWIIVLTLSMSLKTNEVITIDKGEHAAAAYVLVRTGNGDRRNLDLGERYTFAWNGERLDIYTGKKISTFIYFGREEDHDEPVMSVALDRFGSSFPRKHNVRLRKEKLIAIELFCFYPCWETPHRIHSANPGNAVFVEQPTEIRSDYGPEFHWDKKDFPSLNCAPEDLLSDLEKEYREINKLIQEKGLEQKRLVQLYQEMIGTRAENEQEAYNIACHLESFLWRSNLDLESADQYKQIIMTMLGGLKDLRLEIVFGEDKSLPSVERVRRCLESMWDHGYAFTMEDLFVIFETVLIGNSSGFGNGFVKMLKEGLFPVDIASNHPAVLPYVLHWTSLELFECLEEIKQSVLASQATNTVTYQTGVYAQATVCDRKEGSYNLVIASGEYSFRAGQGLALSRSNVTNREFVAEILNASGNVLTVRITWPFCKEVEEEKITTARWRLDPFPSLVKFRRVMKALSNLPQMYNTSSSLFEKIVESFQAQPLYNDEHYNQRKEGRGEEAVRTSTSSNQPFASASQEKEPPVIEAAQYCNTSTSTGNETTNNRQFSGNASQMAAVDQVMRQYSPVTLIQGPPGTGKTLTCAEIVRRWLLGDARPVLVAAETNEGVDNLVTKLIEHGVECKDVLRIGSTGWRATSDMEPLTLEYRYNKKLGDKKRRNDKLDRKITKSIISAVRIVCTTLIGAGSPLLDGHIFEHVLVDEAAQATEPSVLVPLLRGARKLVLVGDDKQLPPMVQSLLASGLNMSLFMRLRSSGTQAHLLDTQYRMHPAISEFPSKEFYNGRLKNGVSASEREVPKGFCFPKPDKPVAFIAMSDECLERSKGSSKLNEHEAEEVTNIVKRFVAEPNNTAQTIGVVSPYKEQVLKLKEMLNGLGNVSVRTVDGFQGQERDVIVFSAVRCNEHRYTGFLDDPRRLNVLLTRARRALLIVGNKSTLEGSECWKKWIKWTEDNEIVCKVTRFQQGGNKDDKQHGSRRRGNGTGSRSNAVERHRTRTQGYSAGRGKTKHTH